MSLSAIKLGSTNIFVSWIGFFFQRVKTEKSKYIFNNRVSERDYAKRIGKLHLSYSILVSLVGGSDGNYSAFEHQGVLVFLRCYFLEFFSESFKLLWVPPINYTNWKVLLFIHFLDYYLKFNGILVWIDWQKRSFQGKVVGKSHFLTTYPMFCIFLNS